MNTTGDANRSVRRTKARLKEALILCMQEKPVRDITVREIVTLADLSRGTFYSYYRDVYDMVDKLEAPLLAELSAITGSVDPLAKSAAYEVILKTLLVVQSERALFGVLLGPNGSNKFTAAMSEILNRPLAASIRPLAASEGTVRLVSGFFIKGFLGLVEEWLASDAQESPENLAAIVSTQLEEAQSFVVAKRKSA